jgi:ferredoxin-NADP reductase
VGDVIRARGPIGRFCFDHKKDHPHLVMVAGGSGVTPFVSIMREHSETLGQEGSPHRMSLFVTFRSDEELMCWKDLEELRAKKGIDVFVTLSRQKEVPEGFIPGRVTPDLIHEKLGAQYHSKTYMTCGPEALMQMVVRHLDSKKVDKKAVKLESFD